MGPVGGIIPHKDTVFRLPLSSEEKPHDLTTKEDLGDENFGLSSNKRVRIPCSFRTHLELTSGPILERLPPSRSFPKEKDRDLTTEGLSDEDFGLASTKRTPVPRCWTSFETQLELTPCLQIVGLGDCRSFKLLRRNAAAPPSSILWLLHRLYN